MGGAQKKSLGLKKSRWVYEQMILSKASCNKYIFQKKRSKLSNNNVPFTHLLKLKSDQAVLLCHGRTSGGETAQSLGWKLKTQKARLISCFVMERFYARLTYLYEWVKLSEADLTGVSTVANLHRIFAAIPSQMVGFRAGRASSHREMMTFVCCQTITPQI